MSLNYRSAKKIIEDSDSSNDENIPTSSYAAALKTKKRNCRVPKGLAPKQSQSCASVNGVSKSKTLEEKREEKKKAAEREKEVQKKQKIYMTTVNDYRKECKNYSRDLNAVEYTMDTSKMKSAIRNQCVEVEWDDSKLFIEAEKEIQRQIKDDPVLRRHVKREVEETANENVMDTKAFRQRIDILSKKSSRVSKKPSSRSTKSPHDDEEVRSDGKRFRMMTNLTTNLKDPIPVFDHLAEEVSNLKISESLFYVYSDKNILSERLKKLDKEFEKPKNKISCKCHTGGSLIKCWQNENCPCYKVNKELRKMQLAGEEAKRNANHQATHHHEPTDFSTFAPKLLNSDHFDLAIGFSCSEECGCKGCCTNNPTFILDKKLNKLEVVRKNNKKGFGVRILNHAKAGTVLCEFTGAINDEDTHDSENDDYAFKVVGDDKDLAGKLARALQADDRLTQMLEEVYAKDWFIDPKRVGNVARTINHSCEPNVELVRVFQKGFSPNHVRFLAVTTEDMFPGEELFLDYGENYFKRFLKNCLCRKLPCENNKSTYKPEILALKKKFTNSHHRRYKEYKRNVLDKLK